MPSGLRLRSSLSGLGRTSLNWSQTSNGSQLQQLKRRKERTWRKRVGVEPTPESAKDTGHGFEDHEDHRTSFASANSIADAMNGARRAAGTEGRGQGLACKKDLWAGQRQAGSGTLGRHDGSLLGADQGGDEVVERGAGADFVIGMRRKSADFFVREQVAGEIFSQDGHVHGLP